MLTLLSAYVIPLCFRPSMSILGVGKGLEQSVRFSNAADILPHSF